MGESFHVEEEHLAGFAVLCSDLSVQAAGVMGHVSNEAKAESGFTGLMELVKPAVDQYAHLTGVRIANRVDLLTAMGTELNRAAWDYSGADRKSYEEISPIMPGQVTGYKDFPGPVGYSAGTAPALEPPALEEADIRAILDEVAARSTRSTTPSRGSPAGALSPRSSPRCRATGTRSPGRAPCSSRPATEPSRWRRT